MRLSAEDWSYLTALETGLCGTPRELPRNGSELLKIAWNCWLNENLIGLLNDAVYRRWFTAGRSIIAADFSAKSN